MERSNRNLWIGLGIVALIVLIALPSFGGGMMMGRGVVGGYGLHPFIGAPWAWGLFGAGLLFRLLIWGAIFFLVFRLFRGFWGRPYRRYEDDEYIHGGLTPAEILRRRYAAGEITREQYEEMLRTLTPTSEHPA